VGAEPLDVGGVEQDRGVDEEEFGEPSGERVGGHPVAGVGRGVGCADAPNEVAVPGQFRERALELSV
jgi:hypothetical protein